MSPDGPCVSGHGGAGGSPSSAHEDAEPPFTECRLRSVRGTYPSAVPLELPQLCPERYSFCPALVVSDSTCVHLVTSPQPRNQPPPWERRLGPVILFISTLLR